MSVSDRRLRDKEELRLLILDGAMRLFAQQGVEKVTIRNIADAIEYSVGTVYVYFKDKNAILHALHTEGFIDLKTRFMVLMSVSNPMERLRAAGRVYIQFAREQPDMYDLMFTVEAPLESVRAWHDDEWNEGRATFSFVRATVVACLEAGHFSGHQPGPLAFMIWSLVHGMCSLEISNRAKVTDLDQPTEEGYAEFMTLLDRI